MGNIKDELEDIRKFEEYVAQTELERKYKAENESDFESISNDILFEQYKEEKAFKTAKKEDLEENKNGI